MKVLLVDEKDATLTNLIAGLEKAKIEVLLCQKGLDAVSLAVNDQPDVILLGEILPDSKGNEILKLLKNNDDTKSIPVAILSKYNHKDFQEEAFANGASNYILKYQIEPDDLITRIQRMASENKGGTGWQPTDEPLIND